MFSVELDKKLIFAGLPVPAEARLILFVIIIYWINLKLFKIRGENDGPKLNAFVSVKNFVLNLEWIWPKETFLVII